jgi:hypothetical protein
MKKKLGSMMLSLHAGGLCSLHGTRRCRRAWIGHHRVGCMHKDVVGGCKCAWELQRSTAI